MLQICVWSSKAILEDMTDEQGILIGLMAFKDDHLKKLLLLHETLSQGKVCVCSPEEHLLPMHCSVTVWCTSCLPQIPVSFFQLLMHLEQDRLYNRFALWRALSC